MTVLPERIVLFEIVGGEGGEALYLNPSQDKEVDDELPLFARSFVVKACFLHF